MAEIFPACQLIILLSRRFRNKKRLRKATEEDKDKEGNLSAKRG